MQVTLVYRQAHFAQDRDNWFLSPLMAKIQLYIYLSVYLWIPDLRYCGSLNYVVYCRELAYCILSAALSTASSFRIWNSSTGILSLPGVSVRHSACGKGQEERGLAYAKVGSSLRSPPGNSRASTRKKSLPTFCFVLSPTPLTLQGAVPHYLSLKKEVTYSSS